MKSKKPIPSHTSEQAARWTARQTTAAGKVEGVKLSRPTEQILAQARREGAPANETVARLREHFMTKK